MRLLDNCYRDELEKKVGEWINSEKENKERLRKLERKKSASFIFGLERQRTEFKSTQALKKAFIDKIGYQEECEGETFRTGRTRALEMTQADPRDSQPTFVLHKSVGEAQRFPSRSAFERIESERNIRGHRRPEGRRSAHGNHDLNNISEEDERPVTPKAAASPRTTTTRYNSDNHGGNQSVKRAKRVVDSKSVRYSQF